MNYKLKCIEYIICFIDIYEKVNLNLVFTIERPPVNLDLSELIGS